MAELIYRHMYKVDVANDPLIRRDVGALLGLYDKAANRFGVELYDNGTALTLSGKTVTGYMIRPDGVTVDISGTASGNQACVELKENCYLYDGAFTLSLKVDEQTVLICDGQIAVTRTGTTVSGNEVINTVSSAEMLGGKPPEYYLTPVNLLDNSNLLDPVNQRGYTSDTIVENTHFIDRWSASGASSFSLGTNGMEIKSGFCHQIVPISKIKSGHAYTLACKMNGNILCYTGMAEETIGAWEEGLVTIYYAGQGVTVYLTMVGATYEWVALYEGAYTAETLPPYVPKPYAVELAECQRYYMKLGEAGGPVGVVHAYSESGGYAFVPTHVRMRKAPSFVYGGMSVGTGAYSDQFSLVTAVSSQTLSGNGVSFWITGSGMTAGQTYILNAANLSFDADL